MVADQKPECLVQSMTAVFNVNVVAKVQNLN